MSEPEQTEHLVIHDEGTYMFTGAFDERTLRVARGIRNSRSAARSQGEIQSMLAEKLGPPPTPTDG